LLSTEYWYCSVIKPRIRNHGLVRNIRHEIAHSKCKCVLRSIKRDNRDALGQVHTLMCLEIKTTLPALTGASRLQSDYSQFSLSRFQTELSVAVGLQDG